MKINDIYKTVTALLEEDGIKIESLYSERCTYLAALFCCKMAETDRDVRESHGFPSQQAFNEVRLDFNDDFPLVSRFSEPAAYFIASMLLVGKNENESERFFRLYSDSVNCIKSEAPSTKHKIINVYS